MKVHKKIPSIIRDDIRAPLPATLQAPDCESGKPTYQSDKLTPELHDHTIIFLCTTDKLKYRAMRDS